MAETAGTDPGVGISGFGTRLSGATTGPIGMITKIMIDGQEVDDIDVSTMNSPGRYKQFVSGMIDPKELSLELVYERINMATILAKVGGVNEVWTVTFPDASTWVQTGHIKKLGTAIPYNDKISQTVTLKMSGAPVFNAASGG